MNTLTKTDLEDLALILEDLVKRMPKMERKERIDLCARIRTVAKHVKTIEETVKDEIKASRKGKEGYVLGELWKAKLTVVPTTRFDQTLFKLEKPEAYDAYSKAVDQERITFEAR